MLLIDPHNPRSQQLVDDLSDQLDLSQFEDVHLVMGGDGWMLECIREHGVALPFLGLNAGTLGFLMNTGRDVPRIVQKLKQRSWINHQFRQLSFIGLSSHGNRISGLSVNDVYLARLGGRAANLRLEIDGVIIVDKLVCDGIVVATALGSTGYSSSAGGSPCHPHLPGMQITPICPHTPRLRPFLIPDSAEVCISVLSPNRRPVQAVADGFSFGKTVELRISRAEQAARLAFFNDHNFTNRMVRKILRS